MRQHSTLASFLWPSICLQLSRNLNGLGDTDLLGSWVGQRAGDLQGGGDKRNLVSLGLVLLTADLVFSLAISMVAVAITSSSTGSHLHGLGPVLVGDLGGGAGWGDGLLLIPH